MVKFEKIGILSIPLLTTIYGCLSAGSYHQRVEKLEIGMPAVEALAIMKGRPVLSDYYDLPELKIYKFKICEIEKECEFERLVFVNDRYAGTGKDVPDLLRENRIERGLSRLNWAIYGALPDAIQKFNPDGPEQEFWIYNYTEAGYQMQLIVFFEEGEIQNWVNAQKMDIPVDPENLTSAERDVLLGIILTLGRFGLAR